MSFFGRKRTRASQTMLLKPRRSRVFRRSVRENVENTQSKISPWAFGYAFLWSAFVAAAVFALFFSSLLRIDQRVIAPMKTVAPENVLMVIDSFFSGKSLGVFPNDTLVVAFLRRKELERELCARFPVFRNAHVSFLFPETVRIVAEERTTMLVLCSGGPCFAIDERGVAFASAPESLGTKDPDAMLAVIDRSAKPILLQEKVFSEEFLRLFVSARRKLFDEIDISTSSVVETPSRFSDELRFRMSEGWELRMSAAVPLEKSLIALRLFFAKTFSESDRNTLEYIDLRTENRIFYLLKGGEPKEGEPTSGDGKKEEKKKKKD